MLKKIAKLFKFIVAWFRIPKGVYCYKFVGHIEHIGGWKTIRCPYWKKIDGRPNQEDEGSKDES